MENKVLAESNVSFCIDWGIFKQLLQDSHFEQVKNDATGKELVLFLGLPGSGKSVCVNYMLGASLVKVKKPGGKLHVCLEQPQTEETIKYAEIGDNDYQSHTLHAQVYQDVISNLFYVDAPAFSGSSNTDSAEEIYRSFSAQLAVHSAKAIKAVVIVIDWGVFDTSTATELKNLLYSLSQIFFDLESVSDSLIFLINKAPKDITINDFHETVLMFQEYQKEKKFLLEKNNSVVHDEELSQLINEIKIINLIENKCRQCPKNIILLDVFDGGESRYRFTEVLKELQALVPKEVFNFKKYNKNRELFEREVPYNRSSINNNILTELMSESSAISERNKTNYIPKEKSLEEKSNIDQKDKNNYLLGVSNLSKLINILLKTFSYSLGIFGVIASVIGVCAVINLSFAVAVVEKVFHELANLSAFYMVIYGLAAIVISFAIHKITYFLLDDVSHINDSVTFDENSKSGLISNFLNNKPFIEKLSFFSEATKPLPEIEVNIELKIPEP